jgi:type I restriction enzyme R subunit
MKKSNFNYSQTESEADTCRKEVLPKLYESGWTDEKILEQRTFTDGKIIVVGRKAKRSRPKRFDYLLRYSRDFPIAIVEAKKKNKRASDGIQQAKDYAEILDLKFAYSTNGSEILEYDFFTGEEKSIDKFPTPDELWIRYNKHEKISDEVKEILLKPFFPNIDKRPRYYQLLAINKATRAILEGKKRVLLTMATGTGKTTVAFQIIYKLWNYHWNRKGSHFRPKILFLADREILVLDPHSKDFAVMKDARSIIKDDGTSKSREMYFSTYQAIAENSYRSGLYREFEREFFDLIVIDECHRGSASDESNWREILEYFSPAVQLGLTATPLREDNKDTYLYFGNPVYTYSLKQGIEDGFLAPYIVHRIVTDVDATGYRPQKDQLDANGYLIPDELFTTTDFERKLSLLPRTKAVAKHLYDFMQKTSRYDKTIVFCVDQEHADQMRRELSNLNSDIAQAHPNYVVRIVAEEGAIGKGFLSKFMDIDEEIPVIVTTSKLLSTGVDIPTCRNIVIFRTVNSMTEFKQIIGRGTRVREDKNKLFFTILDYTGSATSNFADPEFDGEPPLVTQEEIDEDGDTIEGSFEEFPNDDFSEEELDDYAEEPSEKNNEDDNSQESSVRKFYVVDGEVKIVAETVQITDEYGKLRTIEYKQYVKEHIISLYPSVENLKSSWNDLQQRKSILLGLEKHGITAEQLREFTNIHDTDMFDLICHVAYGLKPKTRKERAEYIKQRESDFFVDYSEKARQILNMLLEKYIDYGIRQFDSYSVFDVTPLNELGNITEIAREFGGIDELKKAFEKLQKLLYVA